MGKPRGPKTPLRGTPAPSLSTGAAKQPPRKTPAASLSSGATKQSPRRTPATSQSPGAARKHVSAAKRERAVATAARIAEAIAKKARAQERIVGAVQKQVFIAAQKQRDAKAEQQRIDEQHMRRALELAEQFRGRTAPNPIVGCVIVDALGKVVAEGVHRGPGTKHAEIDALDKLGGAAAGGTLYVSLEPCTHHGRTPPCAPVVAAAKLARVVVGSNDPIASHAGGIAFLENKHGIPVSRVLVDECDLANLPFYTWAVAQQAAFTLKAAMTLDGKIATVSGESKWITGELAREHGHHLRSAHDAILVGIGTVLADDPQLTARVAGGRDPVRIVVDTQLRTPTTARALPKAGGPRTIIATTESASARRASALEQAGAEIWRFPATRGKVSLGALSYQLAEENLVSVLVEGGGQIHAALLAEGLATDILLFIAPRVVGGAAPSWIGGAGVAKLADAWQLEFVGEPRRFGDDLLVRAVVRYRGVYRPR